MPEYRCHACDRSFDAESADGHGSYAFVRCPRCASARTTLA